MTAVAASPPTAPPVRVLSIEDHEAYTVLVREQLRGVRHHSFEVASVTTLQAGIRALSEDHDFDCVLLDLGLPDSEGLGALTALRGAAHDIPIVVLSGDDDEERALTAVHDGAQDYLIKGEVDGRALARAIGYAMERKRSEVELAHAALHDELTGLPNRVLLLDRLQHAISRLGRGGTLAVLFCDVDRFKLVNDSLGHEAGDELLVEVARRIEGVLRAGDTAARFGGDEFVVLCEDISSAADAMAVGTRLAGALAEPMRLASGEEVFVRLSTGIAIADADDASPEALVRDADAAMYRAKERGGAQADLFDSALRRRVVRRLETENALHRALERQELTLHFQPLIDLADGGLHGAEALVRWLHPQRGLVAPNEFIPVAEAIGLIGELGAWVFEQTCAHWVAWGRPDVSVSVNLSASQCADPTLPSTLARALDRTGADPAHVCLEVTETAVMRDPDASGEVLERVKQLGLRLAIDDFGTGYSSLRALRHFPFDEVKIDRSFVAGMADDPAERAIVASVIGLCHDLGLDTVAEGIETTDQRDRLRALGCGVGQGFLFAHPQPPHVLGCRLAA